MISTYKHKNFTWVDLESPNADEVKSLMQKYGVNPMIAEGLLAQTVQSKSEIYKDTTYLVLHFPIYESDRKRSSVCEIDFVIGKKFLITARYKTILPFHEISKLFETGMLLKENALSNNPGALTFFIIKKLYELTLRELDHIQLNIDEIEKNIFRGKEREMVEFISLVRCDILELQRAICAHESILKPLDLPYINNLINELTRINLFLENCKDSVESLQNTNDSLLTDKSNDIMKNLNILAFLTFPLMLIAALFSTDAINTPIIGMKGDFWIIIGLMTILTFITTYIFKRKKWL